MFFSPETSMLPICEIDKQFKNFVLDDVVEEVASPQLIPRESEMKIVDHHLRNLNFHKAIEQLIQIIKAARSSKNVTLWKPFVKHTLYLLGFRYEFDGNRYAILIDEFRQLRQELRNLAKQEKSKTLFGITDASRTRLKSKGINLDDM